MSGNNTGNNPFNGLTIGQGFGGYSGLTSTTTTANTLQNNIAWQQAIQQYSGQPFQYSSGTSVTYTAPLPLTPDTAKDLMAQLEHDKVLVADHKLLFGQYMGKSLREIPLEYIVQLGAAMRGVRIQVAKELRRRRALERLTSNKGRV